ncbi:hypothetical protein ACU4GD_19625 [Cupriavidus basilensis]
MAVGVGRNGPDFNAFAARYLDPANPADPGRAFSARSAGQGGDHLQR